MLADLRSRLADTLRDRVLVVFGRAVDRVEVDVQDDIARGDLVTSIARTLGGDPGANGERMIDGMHLPQLVTSAAVESDGTIEFHLDRGSFILALREQEGAQTGMSALPRFDWLLLQRVPDELWRAARARAEGNITGVELLECVLASSKRR